MRTALRWIALVLGLAASLAAAWGAYTLATYSWNQVVDYRGPYTRVQLPPAKAPVGQGLEAPERVVFVIVDGLREDVSRRMPTLNTLRAHGYDVTVRTAQPSLSFPNWTTLLSGAPQRISGVTTNWYEERVKVETLVDVALAASRTVAVSAPKDFEMLYGVKRTGHVFLRDWTEGTYMTGEIVDHAISLARETSASLLIVHFPDVDEAGHASGGASKAYLDTAMKVDTDLARLVGALQGPRTVFVVAADHGHVDAGGHGGWEDVVTLVPAVFAGPSVVVGSNTGTQDQVAPTVAMLAGLPAPRNATGLELDVRGQVSSKLSRLRGTWGAAQATALAAYADAVSGTASGARAAGYSPARAAFDRATDARLTREREQRLPIAGLIALAAVAAIGAVAAFSWRALVSALAGTAGYYVVYNGLYFGLHRYGLWSLSSFNSESLLKGFMNARMIEAVVAGVVACVVAAEAYLALRREPKRPVGRHLPGWLALGAATVLVVQATLALQVAWYLWWWGASVSWYIPDLMWGFKYDLDLIQATALGAAALLAPLLTWLVGRYHPVRRPSAPVTDARAA